MIIIGGGFSGLIAGYFAQRSGLDFTILEASSRVGGVLESEWIDDYLIEKSANTFLYSPSIQEIISDLNLQNQVIFSQDSVKNRFIWLNNQLSKIPSSPLGFAQSPLFSLQDKCRFLWGLLFTSPVSDEQTIKDFFNHYFGDFFTDNFVDAMVSGMWAGDISKLSMDACFSNLKQSTLKHRSLLQALKKMSHHRAPIFSFKNGTSDLINALAKRCEANTRLNQPVISISSHQDKKNLLVSTTNGSYETDKVILSTPIHQLPNFFEHNLNAADFQTLHDLCQSVIYTPLYLVYTAFKRDDICQDYLNGFGFLVPRNQHKKILGTIFSSSIFNNRAPENEVLLTTFIGGEHFKKVQTLDQESLYHLVNQELQDILDISANPLWQKHVAWQKAVPQYYLGHQDKIQKVQKIINHPNISINANWHNGTALTAIIDKSSQKYYQV